MSPKARQCSPGVRRSNDVAQSENRPRARRHLAKVLALLPVANTRATNQPKANQEWKLNFKHELKKYQIEFL